MAKIQIKSEKLTPFGGIFSIMEQFDALLAQTIDSTLGLRCTMFGYQYSEILRSLMCVYLCGGSCIEDVTTHLMKHLSLHPTLRTCSADTILRAIEELTCKNITYKSASGNSYDFNTADKMNCLLIKALLATGQLKSGQEYDFDFDHQFIETEKHDAKPTYKKFLGYSPGVAVINDMIVGIENRDGNTNVRFNQRETLERIFKRLEASEVIPHHCQWRQHHGIYCYDKQVYCLYIQAVLQLPALSSYQLLEQQFLLQASRKAGFCNSSRRRSA